MQKTVIIYGGAFNPPTNAHQAIIQYLANQAEQIGAELWILPSGSRADKEICVSPQIRLTYLDALVSGIKKTNAVIRIDKSEITQTTQTETIDTVNRMILTYPTTRFIWVFGADSILTMKQWRGGKWLYENLEMWLIARQGNELRSLPPRGKLVPIKTQVVSSSEVRTCLRNGTSVQLLVPSSVYELLSSKAVNYVKSS